MKFIRNALICSLLALFVAFQPVFALSSNSTSPSLSQMSTEEILTAAAPLLEAQSKWYNIRKVSVENVEVSLLEDNTVQTVCNLV